MAHFAQIDENGLVLQIIVVNNSDCGDLPFPESEAIGVAFCKAILGEDTNWLQTSYNSNFRRKYASIGGYYVPELDGFTAMQPFPSWTLNRQIGEWEAPIPMPSVPELHVAVWDEEGQEWDIVLDKANV